MYTNHDELMHLQRRFCELKVEKVELEVHHICMCWFYELILQHEMIKVKEAHENEKESMKKEFEYEMLKKNLELTV